jgi:hypothetical protein
LVNLYRTPGSASLMIISRAITSSWIFTGGINPLVTRSCSLLHTSEHWISTKQCS